MTQRTKEGYNIRASKYDSDPNPHITLEHEDVLTLLNPQKGEKILDAACGTGKYTIEIFNKGSNCVGIDFSEKMLNEAKKKCPQVIFQQVDLTKNLPFSDNEFDKINCGQALKHIKTIKHTLKEFCRILQPNGILVFSVTHPEMNWEGYEMRDNPDFVLSQNSDIFHHKFADYFAGFDFAGFKIDKIVQVPVNEKIENLLTPESYKIVKGRYQIIIFKLIKE